MMWFSLADQTVYFIASIALGAVLAAVYDLVRAVRMLMCAGRVYIFISDVLFFVCCGVITSLFALPFNKGSVRAFVLFGEAVGFLGYRLTIGSVTGRIYAGIARILKRFFKKICEILKKFYDLLLKAGAYVVYNVHEIIDKVQGIVSLNKRRRAQRRTKRRRLSANISQESSQKVNKYERKENKKKKRRGNARGRRRRRER